MPNLIRIMQVSMICVMIYNILLFKAVLMVMVVVTLLSIYETK